MPQMLVEGSKYLQRSNLWR